MGRVPCFVMSPMRVTHSLLSLVLIDYTGIYLVVPSPGRITGPRETTRTEGTTQLDSWPFHLQLVYRRAGLGNESCHPRHQARGRHSSLLTSNSYAALSSTNETAHRASRKDRSDSEIKLRSHRAGAQSVREGSTRAAMHGCSFSDRSFAHGTRCSTSPSRAPGLLNSEVVPLFIVPPRFNFKPHACPPSNLPHADCSGCHHSVRRRLQLCALLLGPDDPPAPLRSVSVGLCSSQLSRSCLQPSPLCLLPAAPSLRTLRSFSYPLCRPHEHDRGNEARLPELATGAVFIASSVIVTTRARIVPTGVGGAAIAVR